MAGQWSHTDLEKFLSSLVSQVPQSYKELIVSFCLACRAGDIDRATQIRQEGDAKFSAPAFSFELIKVCLLFGAEQDLRLVKYVVENDNHSRVELLTLPKWRGEVMQPNLAHGSSIGRNALLFAMDSGRQDIAEYLLQDWLESDVVSVHLKTPFNGQQYFDTIFQQAPVDLSWEAQCAWHFCQRYILQKLPGHDVPLEELEEATMRELETDEDFLLALVRFQGEHRNFKSFWDLYGHSPALFHEMMDLNRGLPLEYFLPFRESSPSTVRRTQILSGWCQQPLNRLKVLAEAVLYTQEHWDRFERLWKNWSATAENYFCQNQASPFLVGLRTIAGKLYNKVLRREATKAINFMSKLNLQPTKNYSTGPEQSHIDSQILYLLAAAGSGKTRRMFDMLERNFGFYFVSGAVFSPLDTLNGENLYLPRSSVISRDAQLLYRTKPSGILEHTILRADYENLFQDHAILLLESRWWLFSEIRNQSTNSAFLIEPGHWLRYQLSYMGSPDPFQAVFHCAILLGDYPWLDKFKRKVNQADTSFLWCFDEVQCDTERVVQSSTGAWTTLSSLVCAFGTLNAQLCRTMNGKHLSLLSGTAMNLKTIQKQVDEGKGMVFGYTNFPNEIVASSLERFSLVKNDDDLKALIRPSITSVLGVLWNFDTASNNLGSFLVADESIFTNQELDAAMKRHQGPGGQFSGLRELDALQKLTEYLESPQIWKLITYYAVRLRGRHRWSVFFIERLFQLCILYKRLNEDLISQASVEVEKAAKQPLIRRVHSLETSTDVHQRNLAKDIFEMAMQASLFGRSRILPTSQGHILIEQALGYVENVGGGDLEVRLVEKLVVDAVMECRFQYNPNISLMDSYLGVWQYRPSAFGFITEDRLAEAIYINSLKGQTAATREAFLSNFDSVYPISAVSRKGPLLLNIKDYVLECNPGPGAPEPDGDGDVGKWLDQVMNATTRETFLLPKEASGPDLIFVLRKDENNRVHRLVCAIQSKVVQQLTIDEGVLDTIDPDRWYNGSTKLSERAIFLDRLHTFKATFAARSDQSVQFLGILVAARNVKSIQEINEIVASRKTQKGDSWFAQDIVTTEENRKRDFQEKLRKVHEKLRKAEQKSSSGVPHLASSLPKSAKQKGRSEVPQIRQQIKTKERQIADADANLKYATEVVKKVGSTDYYLKILDNTAILSTFGDHFHRLLQGTQK